MITTVDRLHRRAGVRVSVALAALAATAGAATLVTNGGRPDRPSPAPPSLAAAAGPDSGPLVPSTGVSASAPPPSASPSVPVVASGSSSAVPHTAPTSAATPGPPAVNAATAVTFDSAGSARSNGSSLSWTQGVSGTNRLLVVEVAVGAISDTGCTLSVSDNGAGLTPLTTVHDDNQHAGYHSVFYRVAPPSGGNTISAQVTGCTVDELTGGSISLDGADQSAPLGSAVTAEGSGSNAAATVGGTRFGGMVVGFVSNGGSVDSASPPSTSRYTQNGSVNTGAGNSAAATVASPGGPATMAWSVQPDWWAVTAIEVRA
ncbi:hypothetical protein [Dactylosporangium sp. CA-092794]|uniref:hypothetical protein n=1 Tax=Dactylosporangium sp. CA-092794 TaxID=3239929 RepID=UPI003D93FE03